MVGVMAVAGVEAKASACPSTQRSHARLGQPDRAESANDGCSGYAERLDGVSARASASGDRTEVGVVSMGQLGGQRPQLGGPATEAAKPASDGGSGQAQGGSDATVTQAGRLGQERRADDLDHIEAAEQRGRRDQHVRRLTRPAARASEAQAPAAVWAVKLTLAREPPEGEHPVGARRARKPPLRSRASTCSGWSATASTLESSLPDPTSESSLTGATGGKGQLVLRIVEHSGNVVYCLLAYALRTASGIGPMARKGGSPS